uniref:uncharacterized protein LOC122582857 isoform X2 n=1 Tax=Erigeron canadensis TaxID=72917 RepID=UPI001CB999B1|nr:uncharacterized protein LOC122582857 isoform X2 [Erigeron canadensis]
MFQIYISYYTVSMARQIEQRYLKPKKHHGISPGMMILPMVSNLKLMMNLLQLREMPEPPSTDCAQLGKLFVISERLVNRNQN